MKKFNFLYILFILTIFSCDDLETIVNNNIQEWNLDYKINLQRTDSGINKNYATITWNIYTDDNFNKYHISFNDDEEEIFESSNFSYIVNLSAGEITQVNFSIFDNSNNLISEDSIQVYTRTIEPISNLNYSVDGTYKHFLTWDASIEIDFKHYIIYRSIDPSISLNYVEPINCNNDNNCMVIDTLLEQSISSFIDSTTTGLGYSYIITTFDNIGLYRKSIIKTGYTESADYIQNINATNIYDDKIVIDWDSIDTPNEFYTIDIWRGTSDNVNDNENHTKLVTIYDPDITYFEDRNNIGSSTSWYYMLKLTNIFGRYHKSSDDIEGITQP